MYRYVSMLFLTCAVQAMDLSWYRDPTGPQLVFENEGSGIDVHLKWQQKIIYVHECHTLDEHRSSVSLRANEGCKAVGPLDNLESVIITSRNRLWAAGAAFMGGGTYDITKHVKHHIQQAKLAKDDKAHLVAKVIPHYMGWDVKFRWDALIPTIQPLSFATVLYDKLLEVTPDEFREPVLTLLEQPHLQMFVNQRENKGLTYKQVAAVLSALVMTKQLNISSEWYNHTNSLIIKSDTFDEENVHSKIQYNHYCIERNIDLFADLKDLISFLSLDYNRIMPYMLNFKIGGTQHMIWFHGIVHEKVAIAFVTSIMKKIGP